MKKLAIMFAAIISAAVVNAAAYSWTAGNIYGSDGATIWSGSVSLCVVGVSEAVYTAIANNGLVNVTSFSTDAAPYVEGSSTSYDFYFVIEDNGKTFTSDTKAGVVAQKSSTSPIGFGNMQTATQNAANWSSSSVPEPTSGLLVLLGMAGLALRRRRA